MPKKGSTYRRVSDDEIAEALKRANGLISYAAKSLGVGRQAVTNRIKKSPALQEILNDAREEFVDIAEMQLKKLVEEADRWAVGFALERLGKSRGYAARQEITGADGSAVEIKIYIPDNGRK